MIAPIIPGLCHDRAWARHRARAARFLCRHLGIHDFYVVTTSRIHRNDARGDGCRASHRGIDCQIVAQNKDLQQVCLPERRMLPELACNE